MPVRLLKLCAAAAANIISTEACPYFAIDAADVRSNPGRPQQDGVLSRECSAMSPTVYMAVLSASRFRHCLPRYSAAILDGDFARAYCVVDDAAELGAHAPARTRESGSEEL